MADRQIIYKGIDLSYHNGNVNFTKVKAAGFNYCILRCGYRGYGSAGVLMQDPMFKTYANAVIKSGMPYGVYFFSQAINEREAIEEAQYALKLIKAMPVQPLFPVYIDTEYSSEPSHRGRADGLGKAQRTAVVRAFCDEIERQGYFAGVYASTSWYKDKLYDIELTNYTHWIAQYYYRCTYSGNYGMWQYGGSTNLLRQTKVDGVQSANCDQNYCYIDYPSVIKNAGLNGYTKKVVIPKYKITTAEMTAGDKQLICSKLDDLKIGYSVSEIK